jgi:hemerythrin-like domain-containing protein
MDALKLLKQDHDEVKQLLEKLDSTTERGVKTRQELFSRVQRELRIHEAIEEEIFYPRLRENAKTKEIALEGYEEHHVVDLVMSEIDSTPFDDETWGAKFTVMKENVEHHIEEEEGEMFKLARQALGTEQLAELGERMEARKKELQATQAA